MNIFAKWKVILILAVLILSTWFLVPTIRWYSMTPKARQDLQKVDYKEWKSINEGKLNLGLDLQGGVSLLLRVDTDALQAMAMDKEIERINTEFTAKNSPIRATLSENSAYIIIAYPDEDQRQAASNIAMGSDILEKIDSPDGKLYYQPSPLRINQKLSDTVEQARHVIENRVNELGLSETMVAKVGDDKIAVQLPGETDPERATNIIRRQAFLEFKLVADDALINSIIDEQGNLRPGAIIPDGYELKYLKETKGTDITKIPILVKKRADLTGDHITSARVSRDSMSFGAAYVELKLDREGARMFERVTGMNVNKKLAIVLDGEVKSAPNIQERIPNGSARITGQYTENEARDLALVLKSGALPVPLVIEESRTVGPTLGYDSIRKGIMSAVIGGILIVLFMFVYYKGSGLIADLALILNLIILMAAMSMLGATLTVPGIAGIVLTIGMAVDANVLIFERIREELRAGKTPRAAIEAGYGRAFSAILDSNVTTIIAAFMLVQFGSSAVKGFAITLMVGITISMFTAILVTRVVFDWISLRSGFKKLSI